MGIENPVEDASLYKPDLVVGPKSSASYEREISL
jgi:hypothetical protein